MTLNAMRHLGVPLCGFPAGLSAASR